MKFTIEKTVSIMRKMVFQLVAHGDCKFYDGFVPDWQSRLMDSVKIFTINVIVFNQ